MVSTTTNNQALAGVRVADFSWVVGAPIVTKLLANYGATVIRVESSTRPDPMRTTYPFAGAKPGINRSGCFSNVNDGKYSLSLNLNHPQARNIARKLIGWADVVVENFTPGWMQKWGLSYEENRKLKSDIIMVSISMQGQTGPHASLVGFGFMLQALGGFVNLVGWPDRLPVGYPIAYHDYIAALYSLTSIMAALEHRRRTGEGQHIDLSMFEAGLSFLSSAVLNYVANQRMAKAQGNRCVYAAPHGAYRCLGDDRWCAIAVFSDEQWKAFCQAVGELQWTKDPKFDTLLDRKQNEDELDKLVEEWTSQHVAEELMVKLQVAGVPAGTILTNKDLRQDPQLEHHNIHWELEHIEMGVTSFVAPPMKLSKTPCELHRPSPCLGQHTEYVCTRMLGISDDEFIGLLNQGIFE